MKSIWYLLVAMMVSVTVAAVTIPKAAARTVVSQQPVFPGCAWGADWGGAVNADTILANPALNVAEPDPDADYWVLLYTVEPGERITLAGQYPDARFMSFEVYAANSAVFTANGVNSVLTDYQITPDRGSINPWQHDVNLGQHHATPRGRYTVTLSSDAEPGKVNTVPIAPTGTAAGSLGILMLRVYVQTGSVWSVPLPSVTFSEDGVSKLVPACSREQQTFPSLPPGFGTGGPNAGMPAIASDASTSGSGELLAPFFAAARGGLSNLDSGYLSAGMLPATNGDVLVIRGKAPASAHGSSPRPWPSRGVDLRYWSICDYLYEPTAPTVINQLPDGQIDFGCRRDDQIALTRGYYTIVVGTEAQRAAIEKIPGATFLPVSSADPTAIHVLYMRNMLANPSFAEAIQNAPTGDLTTAVATAAADQQAMGAYYPQAAFSTIPDLAKWAATGTGLVPLTVGGSRLRTARG